MDKQEQEKSLKDLKDIVQKMLDKAKQKGATAAEVVASVDDGYSVSVRMGDVETLEYHKNKGISINVYFGQSSGHASTSDTSPDALERTVNAACDIAAYTEADPAAGLADPELLAKYCPDLDLYHPWNLSIDEAINLAKTCEAEALQYDKRIVNSDGANLSTHQFWRVYGNTHGFLEGYLSTRHSLNCSVIAKENESMERDYGYTLSRRPDGLASPKTVGCEAASNALARLSPRKIKTCQVPVLFRADVAAGLLGSFFNAIAGSNLYRKSTFLLDHLNKQVFSKHIRIYEMPHILQALGSSYYDNDGVSTYAKDFITDGILNSYLLGIYSARRLGMKTTGNAGGVTNVFIETSDHTFTSLLKQMGKGLVVTELLGQGANILTGDYSRGASGFWVENGEIQYPVSGITVAGNLRDMFLNFRLVGNDVDTRSNIQTGSILVDGMTVAGE